MKAHYWDIPPLNVARALMSNRDPQGIPFAIPLKVCRKRGLSFATRLKIQGYKKQRTIYPYMREVAGSSAYN